MAKSKGRQPDQATDVLRVRTFLRGHREPIMRVAWSPDGMALATASVDKTVRIWDAVSGRQSHVLDGHTEGVNAAKWHPTLTLLATCSYDQTVRIWNSLNWQTTQVLGGFKEDVTDLDWSPDGTELATCSIENGIELFKADTFERVKQIRAKRGYLLRLAFSPDGALLATGGSDRTVRLLLRDGTESAVLGRHDDEVVGLAFSPRRKFLASCSSDATIAIWDCGNRRQMARLNGHTQALRSVSFSSDGMLLASNGMDGELRIWRHDTDWKKWTQTAHESENPSGFWPPTIAFHPSKNILASFDDNDLAVRLWDVQCAHACSPAEPVKTVAPQVYYKSAQIALVGDSGVGKTTLGHRIAKGVFRPDTQSTHGEATFDNVGGLGVTDENMRCEAILWDFAGQSDYRIIHTLFAHEADIALLVFDPQKPLSGVEYWIRSLRRPDGPQCRLILVAGRCDVGHAVMSQQDLAAFAARNHIDGPVHWTSAATGTGVPELIERICRELDWPQRPTTVTTSLFESVRERLPAIAAQSPAAGRRQLLFTVEQLKARLSLAGLDISPEDLTLAVRYLVAHGRVTAVLQTSEQSPRSLICLDPATVRNVAASFILAARADPQQLGALEETKLRSGEYRMPELTGLDPEEAANLRDAVIRLFLARQICLAEPLGNSRLFVFPALVTNAGPPPDEAGWEAGVTYLVDGPVENVYAAVVVLLGYTNTFNRARLWKDVAEYGLASGPAGQGCRVRRTDRGEGLADLTIFYNAATLPDSRDLFRGSVALFLKSHPVGVTEVPAVRCPACGEYVVRDAVINAVRQKKGQVFCPVDGTRLNFGQPQTPATPATPADTEPYARTALALAFQQVDRLVEFRQGHAGPADAGYRKPTCFVSYAWGSEVDQQWVRNRFAEDLKQGGIKVELDVWQLAGGAVTVAALIEKLRDVDAVVAVCTPEYGGRTQSYLQGNGSVLAIEQSAILRRLQESKPAPLLLFAAVLRGNHSEAVPFSFGDPARYDFSKPSNYFTAIFDLILALRRVPPDAPGITGLRGTLEADNAESRRYYKGAGLANAPIA